MGLVSRCGGGGGSWALIGTGAQTGLVAGSQTVSIFKINTNAPAIFEAIDLGVSTTFHDVTDDTHHSDRWALNAFQIRHASLDIGAAAAWTGGGGINITDSLTVGSAGELVYAFLVKDYIRGLTSAAPFSDIYTEEVPSFPFSAQLFAASASGQGPGAVGYSGQNIGGHVLDTTEEVMMVGLAPNGGAPTQIALQTTYVDASEFATAVLPSGLVFGDLVLLHLVLRDGNGAPSIATPGGWSLVAKSPIRGVDPNAGLLDQFAYLHVVGISDNYVLQINTPGVYELHSGLIGDDAVAAGQIETTLSVSAGGTFATWDGGNYIVGGVSDGATTHWRPNQTKILAVDTAPVQVTLSANNRTGATIAAWEGGIFVQRLGDSITTATWDI